MIVTEAMQNSEVFTKIAGLVKSVNRTISIVENLTKNLQYGLVKQSRTGRIFGRGKTVKVSDKTKDVKLTDKSKIGKLVDKVKNIKLFKRGRGVKGV